MNDVEAKAQLKKAIPKAALCMASLDEPLSSGPAYCETETLSITLPPVGSIAVLNLARVSVARRGTVDKRRSVSQNGLERRVAGPSCRAHASLPDKSSWQLCSWYRETEHRPMSLKAVGDSHKGIPSPQVVAFWKVRTSESRRRRSQLLRRGGRAGRRE